jgi:signal transduction histidine kinase
LFGFVVPLDFVARDLVTKAAAGVDLGVDADVRLVADAPASAASVIASAALGDVLPGFSVAVSDRHGRSLSQLTARERWTYGGLVGGVLIVLLAGVVFTTRAWTREAELSRLRTDFVSNVSHELKTPLALIRMFGETLESGAVLDAEKRHEFYGIIRRESERLTHLINNVLDASKIEAGTRHFALEPGDIVALVRDAIDAYASLFKRLDVAVTAALPDEAIAVRMDRDAVAQALVNLFQNAIRYASDGRQVAVTVRQTGDEVTVAVADRGPGIPAGELGKIFQKFYRSEATSGSTPGSGLGLSIVKHVMGAHGGRVDVDSVVGHGSIFTLVFPADRGAA